jgi:hypothetical protein
MNESNGQWQDQRADITEERVQRETSLESTVELGYNVIKGT